MSLQPMQIDEIGGGKVLRAFSSSAIAAMLGQKQDRLVMGTMLDQEHLRMLPPANRNALIENRFIQVWPLMAKDGAAAVARAPVPLVPHERHVISRGFGKFDVIEGRKLNADPLTKDQAEAMAKPPADAAPQGAAASKRSRKRKGADAEN